VVLEVSFNRLSCRRRRLPKRPNLATLLVR